MTHTDALPQAVADSLADHRGELFDFLGTLAGSMRRIRQDVPPSRLRGWSRPRVGPKLRSNDSRSTPRN